MCKDCVRILDTLLPNATEQEANNFLWGATSFPMGSVRHIWYGARQALRAGGGTIEGAIRYSHLELHRQMRKLRTRERLDEQRRQNRGG